MTADEASCVPKGCSARWGATGRLPGRLRDCKQIFDFNFVTLSDSTNSDRRIEAESKRGGEAAKRKGKSCPLKKISFKISLIICLLSYKRKTCIQRAESMRAFIKGKCL